MPSQASIKPHPTPTFAFPMQAQATPILANVTPFPVYEQTAKHIPQNAMPSINAQVLCNCKPQPEPCIYLYFRNDATTPVYGSTFNTYLHRHIKHNQHMHPPIHTASPTQSSNTTAQPLPFWLMPLHSAYYGKSLGHTAAHNPAYYKATTYTAQAPTYPALLAPTFITQAPSSPCCIEPRSLGSNQPLYTMLCQILQQRSMFHACKSLDLLAILPYL